MGDCCALVRQECSCRSGNEGDRNVERGGIGRKEGASGERERIGAATAADGKNQRVKEK